MVEVVSRTPAEIAVIEKESKLVKIAQEVCGERFEIRNGITSIGLLPKNDDGQRQISVSFLSHTKNHIPISVYSSNYLKDAIELGEAYEATREYMVTVKKDYPE